MNKEQALELIDAYKSMLVDPLMLLHWTWLRVIILQIPDSEWEKATIAATEILSK